MILIYYISIYLLIGVILMMFFDWVNRKLIDDGYDEENLGHFNNLERVYVILLWPYSLFVFIRGFFFGE